MTCYLFHLAVLVTPQPKCHLQPRSTCFFDGCNSQLLQFQLLNIALNPNTFQVISQKFYFFCVCEKLLKSFITIVSSFIIVQIMCNMRSHFASLKMHCTHAHHKLLPKLVLHAHHNLLPHIASHPL